MKPSTLSKCGGWCGVLVALSASGHVFPLVGIALALVSFIYSDRLAAEESESDPRPEA